MTTSWSRIALLYAVGVLAAGQLGIVPPLVPALQRDLGLSLWAAGMAVSIVTLVGAVAGLPAGGWCEAIGHDRALVIGLLIMASAAAVCATAEGAALLLAARALAGLGYLLVAIAAPSLIAHSAQPRHQPIALSLWGTFVPVGIALAGLAAARFAGSANWRSLFAVDSTLLAFALIVALLSVRRIPLAQRPERSVSWAALGAALPLAAAFFCFALLFLALAGLLPIYLVDGRGLPMADAGRIAAVATAAGIAGSLAAGGLMRRGLSPAMLTAIGLLASAALAALSFSPALPLGLAIAGLAASFAVGGLAPAATFAAVPRIATDARAIGPINGLVAQTGSLGSLAGPPLLALWVEGTSWALAPVLLLAIAAVGAIAAFAVRPQR
jgi:MFS family permease